MANQGLLAQLKPTAATLSVLYSAPIDSSASTVLTIANDGTGSAYDVAVKNYDQKLALDASSYLLHPGDVISSYYITLNTNMNVNTPISATNALTTDDGEASFKFESFFIPEYQSVYVKDVSIRSIATEAVSGTFAVGDTITTGVSPDDTTAVVYDVDSTTLYIGPSTINGGGAEFVAGDSITSTSGGTATISTGGIGTASNDYVFSTTTIGGIYRLYIKDPVPFFGDRVYRFDVSDSSMSGRDFKLSTTINGEWGPDGSFGTGDDGSEYTTAKTTGGTPGTDGYVQYDFSGGSVPTILYFYDGGTGTAGNSVYGGDDRLLSKSNAYEYSGFYIYDLEGTITNNVDSFTFNGITYTITAQSSGPYGYVREYSGTSLKFVKGPNSPDFAGSETFRDVPRSNSASRSIATVSSVTVDTDAVEASNYITENNTNSANNVEKITSLVVGPGERVLVSSDTANNTFSLIGFEDATATFTTRVFGQT